MIVVVIKYIQYNKIDTMLIRKIKYLIAKSLFFIPDLIMLKIQYRILLKRALNIRHPQRFTEKIQYYKAYYHHPEMLRCVDKYLVREFVTERLGTTKYLNILYQVCDSADLIDFTILPSRFVIKTTDGGNGDNILICTNKELLNQGETVNIVNSWRNKQYYLISREWAYKGAIQSRIIVEQYLESDENLDGSINDYKFLCFDGEFRYLWVDKDRYSDHKRGFWDKDLNFLKNVESDHPTFDIEITLPININEMIDIAEKLSKGFPFARIDLYNIKGQIYFGEITFYPWSGYVKYTPDSFDYELGAYFNI